MRLALLSLALTVWGAVAQPQDPVLVKALTAHKDGQLEAAVSSYQDYLKRNPRNFQIRSNLGAALAGLGRYDEAIQEYRAALKLSPANPQISLNFALALYKAGNLVEAAREFSTLRALTPDNLQVTLLLADCWLQLGENKRVIQLLEPLADKTEDLAYAYLLGTALLREKEVEKGQRQLDRIFARGDSAEARLLMGTAKMKGADYPGALEEFTKAVQLNPNLPAVQSYYGQALMATGDSEGAAQAFRAELRQNPNDYDANLNLAVILKQSQEFEEARRLLERALRVRPGDLRSRYQLASIDLAEGNVESARRELELIVKEAPKFTEAHVSLATVYYRLRRKEDGDRERAIVEQLNAEAQAQQPKGEAFATVPESKK